MSSVCYSSSARVCIDVGGMYYYTTMATLQKSPTLKQLLEAQSGDDPDVVPFVDRDGGLFHSVLFFLRNGSVPSTDDSVHLDALVLEAGFYGLREMELQLLEQMKNRGNEICALRQEVARMHSLVQGMTAASPSHLCRQPQRDAHRGANGAHQGGAPRKTKDRMHHPSDGNLGH